MVRRLHEAVAENEGYKRRRKVVHCLVEIPPKMDGVERGREVVHAGIEVNAVEAEMGEGGGRWSTQKLK